MDEPRMIRGASAGREPVDELEELLRFYAARRLAPRYGAMAQIRASVLTDLHSVHAVATIDPTAARRARLARRFTALGLAATLSLATAAAVVAAPPGSPLYATRVWLEGVALPHAADDRAEAHRRLLESRLAEVQAAAKAGNPAAVAQALAAYRAEVGAALADVGDDAEQLARLEVALGTHLVVLEALQSHVPSQAAEAIEAARDAGDKAVEKIKEKKAGRGGPRSSPASLHD